MNEVEKQLEYAEENIIRAMNEGCHSPAEMAILDTLQNLHDAMKAMSKMFPTVKR